MENKSFLKSKTIWANIIGILAIFAAPAVGGPQVLEPETGALVLGIANIVLRFFTNKGIIS